MDSSGHALPTEPIGGRYRVEREVGRGGMGSVWLAHDERLGRAVAIKRVGRLPGESLPHLARAMREARSSAALNHPNVVSVYDAVEEGEHLWLVMEYVPGRTLAEVVAAEGPLAPDRVARIGAQVADGLAAAHAVGTVHRDVKPGNVLVGDDDVAKISDFGIARSAGDDKLTQTGLMTGTPAYFAPELARGDEATPASDVWGLGATLYAAVEGHSPYPSQANPLALMARIAHEAPPEPRSAGPLRRPISRMMDIDPVSRPTMAACAQELHRSRQRG
jgi:serine/threonine protein kinase